MELSLLTLNLHTYEQHPRHCSFDTMHQHEREVQIIADKRTPYRTLVEVLYTMGQSEFKAMRFVVLKKAK